MTRLWNKAKGGSFFDCRAMVLAVPDLTSLPGHEGEMDKLVELDFWSQLKSKISDSSALVRERRV